jgi:TRAP-type C4-dicarboxylate transport system permease small subunit
MLLLEPPMRRLLDGLYSTSAAFAALCLVIICVLILAQSIGRLLGVVVPSAGEFSGYAVAASTFLALAPTFRAGGHIRVTLAINALPVRIQRGVEILALLTTLGLVSYMAWFLLQMTRRSVKLGDISPGLIKLPLWAPQAVMTVGAIIFVICLVDALIDLLRGRKAPYAGKEAGE